MKPSPVTSLRTLLCLKAVLAAYDRKGYMDSIEAVQVAPLLHNFGYVAVSSQYKLVAFRGSTDLKSWIEDAEAIQVPLRLYGDLSGVPAGNVHFGFDSVYMEVIDRIRQTLAGTDPNKPVYCTGHSLGGAVASLVAADLARDYNVRVYTFGSPRVGDMTWRKWFNLAVQESVRVVLDNDLVPRLPFFGYDHVKGLLHLTDNGVPIGRLHGFLDKLVGNARYLVHGIADLDTIHDHSVDRYYAAIKALTRDLSVEGMDVTAASLDRNVA